MNREAFEAWYKKEIDAEECFMRNENNTHHYLNLNVHFAFKAWQAALASQAQQPTEHIEYRHKNGNVWYHQSVKDELPSWAYDVRPYTSQAQQSQWISLRNDDYSHLKGNELIYAYGIGCGIFEAYLKDYEVVRDDMFNRNTSEVTHIMVRKPVSLPPAPEGE